MCSSTYPRIQNHITRCDNEPTVSLVESILFPILSQSLLRETRSKNDLSPDVVSISFFFFIQENLDLLTSSLFIKENREEENTQHFRQDI